MIVCYVDDKKISHEDPDVVGSISKQKTKDFGKLSIIRGKDHTFLGMDIKIRDNKKIKIDTIEKTREAIAWIGEEIEKSVFSPAKQNR